MSKHDGQIGATDSNRKKNGGKKKKVGEKISLWWNENGDIVLGGLAALVTCLPVALMVVAACTETAETVEPKPYSPRWTDANRWE